MAVVKVKAAFAEVGRIVSYPQTTAYLAGRVVSDAEGNYVMPIETPQSLIAHIDGLERASEAMAKSIKEKQALAKAKEQSTQAMDRLTAAFEKQSGPSVADTIKQLVDLGVIKLETVQVPADPEEKPRNKKQD